MTEHLLDFPEEQLSLRRLRAIRRIQRTLLASLLLIAITSLVFVFATIPIDTSISSPQAFSGWKVPYLISALLLFGLPLASLPVALLLGLVQVTGFRYAQRTAVAFLIVCTLIEGIALYQLLMD